MAKLNIKEKSINSKLKIPFFFARREHKYLKSKILKAIENSFLHGQTLQGPEVVDFEKKISKFVGRKFAVAVGSCTDALFFSLKAGGVKNGDEVIVTSYSYLASATCILRCGAKPIFVDVDENGNMQIDKVLKKINKKTKAIIYVHLFGYLQDIDKLVLRARKKKILLIEDFAQALGASIKQRKAGSFGDISCTSFDPTKVLSAPGSGGIVVTNNKNIKNKIAKLRYHGKNKFGDHDILGINSQMPTITAASLLVKFKYFKECQTKRISIARKYIKNLKNLNLSLPPLFKNEQHIYHKFVIRTKYRDELLRYLNKNGVQSLIHYKKPLHKLKIFKGFRSKLPISENLTKTSLSIPIHPYLKKKEVDHIIKVIKDFYNKY